MIGKVGQTSSNFFEQTSQRYTVKQTAQPTTKKDEFIRTSGKSDLWSYSMKEVKSPLVRSYSAFGSIPEPDWNTIHTKGRRTLSYEEINEQMKLLAEREVYAQNAGASDEEWSEIHQIRNYLCLQYLSDISPDRKALYKQAEKTVQQNKQEQEEPKYPLYFTLVDILCDLDDIAFDNANKKQGTVTTIHKTGGGYDYEIKSGNQPVMRTINGEWTYQKTPLEEMKRDEFYKIYDMLEKDEKKNKALFNHTVVFDED